MENAAKTALPTSPEKQIEFLSKIISNPDEYDKFLQDPEGYCGQITLDEKVVEEFVKGSLSVDGKTVLSDRDITFANIRVREERTIDPVSIILPDWLYVNLNKPRPGFSEKAQKISNDVVKAFSEKFNRELAKTPTKGQVQSKPLEINKIYETPMFVVIFYGNENGDGDDMVVYYKLAWRINIVHESLLNSNLLQKGSIVYKK